jgi:Family of unknown function (DUF6326)
MQDVRVRLSMLWVFLMFNYLYADVMALFDPGIAGDAMTGTALLAASFLMEIPMAMVLLSRTLTMRPNRWANVIAGTLMAVVAVSTLLFVGPPTSYYVFFGAVEIPCLLFIVWTAWRWTTPAESPSIA